MIRTVEELIEAFGGTQAVREARGVSKQTVSDWRVTNRLPERHRYWAFRECGRLGVAVDPALFEGGADGKS